MHPASRTKLLKGKNFHYRNDVVIPPGRKIGIGVLDVSSRLSGFHTIGLIAKLTPQQTAKQDKSSL